MVFSDLFCLYMFLPVLALLYFVTPYHGVRRGVLVAFSLLFYAWGEPRYVFLMIGMVAADYLFGRLIAKAESQGTRRLWLVLAVVSNLGVLGVYKYLGFFTETLNQICGLFGSFTLPVVSLALPIGISFFTFQTMSYVIDVYRGDTEVQESFFKLLLYVSFFPQLIAGPIVRYKDIEAQLDNRHVDAAEINEGICRFSVGLCKKVLIADNCDAVVKTLMGLSEATVAARWAGALFFTLQLYFDFSGYSDMAIGLGRVFGFRFNENFKYPLVSSSATEFWRRWHISLGTFFRDYVYIPLGGNRHNQTRNILVVWFLTGMWHGASWNFILWGVYYGILLLIEKHWLLSVFDRMPKWLSFPVTKLYVIFITVFGFAMFYFDGAVFTNLGVMFGVGASGLTSIVTNSVILDNIFLLAAACVFAVPVVPAMARLAREKLHLSYEAERLIKTAFSLAVILVATVRLCGNSYSAFLYFRF